MKTRMLVLEATFICGAAMVATPVLAKPATHQSSAPLIVCNMHSCHPVHHKTSKKGRQTHSGTASQGRKGGTPHH